MTIPKGKVNTPTPVAEEADVEKPTDRLGPTEVAILIGQRYQYTRDLMLKGDFGEVKYDKKRPKGTLTIARSQVDAWKARKREQTSAPKPAANS